MRFVLLLTLCAAPAFADPVVPPKQTPAPAADDCARARAQGKTCVLDISGEDIEGDKPLVTDAMLSFRKWAQAQSLIHIRRDFIPEIVKTAEDL